MKNLITIIFCTLILSNISNAQDQTALLLKQPANWQFEKFSLPPQFAPGIPYKGVEELRFSPGMFVKDSATYFTYAFVAELDNTNSISQYDIRNYLVNYFKGLCSSTAKQRNLSIDTSQISVEIKPAKNGNEDLYNAVLNIFGVFTDGAPVKLNMDIRVKQDKAASKIYLVFIASPLNKTDKVWKELYDIQNNFTIP